MVSGVALVSPWVGLLALSLTSQDGGSVREEVVVGTDVAMTGREVTGVGAGAMGSEEETLPLPMKEAAMRGVGSECSGST